MLLEKGSRGLWDNMKKAFASALFITFVSIGVTWALMWLFAQNAYGFVPAAAMLKSAIVSILIAFPTGWLLEDQKKQLSETTDRLRESQRMLRSTLEEMKRSSQYDCLTSVLNRGTFFEKLEKLQDVGVDGAVLMIDADDFKSINDRFGHATGDRALKIIADSISIALGANDLVGRLGGEEFAVFLHGADQLEAEITAEKIRKNISDFEFWATDYRLHPLSVSIGGDMLTSFSTMLESLARADYCLYVAKRRGKNSCAFADHRKAKPDGSSPKDQFAA